MFDFWIPLLLIFITATIAAIVSRRKNDRCLKQFRKQEVIIQMDSDKYLWGAFFPYPTAIELQFSQPAAEQQQESGKASYILYENDIAAIKLILMPPPEPGTKKFKKWTKIIRRTERPSLIYKTKRWLWNIVNTLRDAVTQSSTMVLGTLKTKTAMGKVAGADKKASEISNTILGSVPNAYEPILEKYLCKQVVVEMVEDGEIVEFTGLLQEYSEKYILLRKVALELPDEQPLPTDTKIFDIIFPRKKALVRHRIQEPKEIS